MTLFVTAQNIIDTVLNNKNFPTSKLKDTYIEGAQLEYIRELTGIDYYDELILEAPSSYTTLNQPIMDNYLEPALCWYTVGMCAPFLHIELSRAGFMMNDSEHASQGTNEQRAQYQKTALKYADTYAEQFTAYIEDADRIASYANYAKGKNILNETKIVGGIVL